MSKPEFQKETSLQRDPPESPELGSTQQHIPGLGAGSLVSLGGEHAAPHAGNPGGAFCCPSAPDFPIPTASLLSRGGGAADRGASSPGLAHSAGGRWGSTAEPQPPPPRTCRSAAPPDTSGGPALRLAPSPPDLLSPRQGRLSARQAAPSSSAARGAVAAQPEPASSSPRDRRATPNGARAHRAPLLPNGSGLSGGRARRPRQAAATRCLDLEVLRLEPRPAKPPGPLPSFPVASAVSGQSLRCGLASAQLLFAPPGPEAGVPATVVASPPYPARGPRLASRRRGLILLLRRPLSLRRVQQASAVSPPHAAGANLPCARRRGDPEPRAPAAALRLCSTPHPRPRTAPLQIPQRPRRTRARSHLSGAPHVVSGFEERLYAEEPGRGRQTLTKCRAPTQPRGEGLGAAVFGDGPYFG
ncbi:hypothetical protein NN561_001570 [Cricetulus griseus]